MGKKLPEVGFDPLLFKSSHWYVTIQLCGALQRTNMEIAAN